MTELGAGTRLGRYEIQGVVGRGGMGVVYRAIQDGLDRAVALKVIAPTLAEDLDFRARFQREAKLAASLDHPNVIPVYEAGEEGSTLYLAMRLVDGEDLATLVKRTGPLPPEQVVDLITQVASALDAAHAAGLVHRDVKPHNVLLAGQHAYLTDFGLTKQTDSDATLTRTGAVLGTLDYSAPEQLRGEATDGRSDVYSLACMTFQLLTGKPPFERNSDTARMLAHLNDPPPDLPPGLPPLGDAIKRGMAKAPADRFATAGEFAAALTGAPVPAPATKPKREGMPRGLRIALGAVLPLLLIAAIVGVVVLSGDEEQPAATPSATSTAEATTAAEENTAPRTVKSIPTGAFPNGLAIGQDVVWVVTRDDATLERIDPETNEVDLSVPVEGAPDSVAADEGIVYVTSQGTDLLSRFEARPDPVAQGSAKLGKDPKGVSLGLQLVWVANSGDGTVSRIDRATNEVLGEPGIGVGGHPITAFVGDGRVWVPDSDANTVTVITVETAEVEGEPTPVCDDPRDAIEAFGFAWIVCAGDNVVQRLDLETHQPEGDPIAVGKRPHKIAADETSLWVTNTGDDTVTELDPVTARPVGRPIPVGVEPVNIAAGLGAVWVANTGDNTVTRIAP